MEKKKHFHIVDHFLMKSFLSIIYDEAKGQFVLGYFNLSIPKNKEENVYHIRHFV